MNWKRRDVCRSHPPAGHRFVLAEATHTIVQTSRAHEVLKRDTAGVQRCNSGANKDFCVCVYVFVYVCAAVLTP